MRSQEQIQHLLDATYQRVQDKMSKKDIFQLILFYNFLEIHYILKQIRTKSGFLYNIGKKSVWKLTMKNNKINTQIFCSQYIVEVSLQRVNEPEQEETDQRVMILFPTLNLEALRVAADTLVPRFIPAIKDSYKDNFQSQQCQFKCRTNLGCLRRLFRVTILEDEV
ncbi:Hypothetical_protein [Hexamita inflata]|uniref:Hypothetical_protein n=1 Tax=Hexamita inflata TaxID=28002 RepID=A0AA86UXL6_9EUKA|nr:Hypothetical protein HINF_LOCUS59684 [Hexamita inflata]